MYKDLERNHEKLCSHPIVSALAGENETPLLPEDLNNYDHDEKEKPIDVFQVVDADASQQDAILLSKRGVSFVLQGPPGTGKSQTITNIISEAMAEGKKILFVSEKMAALQVVYNRLSNAHLADFCFILHNHKANKREVLQELQKTINIDKTKVKNEILSRLETLDKLRHNLNQYQKDLHTKFSPLQISIYEIYGMLAELASVPDVSFPIDNIESFNVSELNNKINCLKEFSIISERYSTDSDNNVWKGTLVKSLSNQLRHDIDSNVSELVSLLHSLNNIIAECCNNLGISTIDSLAEVDSLLELLRVLKSSHQIPLNWLQHDDLDELYNNYKRVNHILEKYLDEVTCVDCRNKYELFKRSYDELVSIAEPKEEKVQNDWVQLGKTLSELSQILLLGFSKSTILADRIGVEKPKNLTELQSFIEFIHALLSLNGITPTNSWFSLKQISILRDSVEKQQYEHERYRTNIEKITDRFDKQILNIDSYPILQRFRSDYNTFFRFLKPQYRKDKELLRSYFKEGKSLSYEEAFNVLSQLSTIAEEKKIIDEIQTQCHDEYGIYYDGINTTWDRLKRDLNTFEQFIKKSGNIPPQLRTMLLNDGVPYNELTEFINNYSNTSRAISCLISLLPHKDSIVHKDIEDLQGIANSFLSIYQELRHFRKSEDFSGDSSKELLTDFYFLSQYQSDKPDVRSQNNYVKHIFSQFENGQCLDEERLQNALILSSKLKKCINKHSLTIETACKIFTDKSFSDYCSNLYENCNRLEISIHNILMWFKSLFDEGKDFYNIRIFDLISFLTSCKNNKDQLEKWIDYQSIRQKCKTFGLEAYLERLDTHTFEKEYVVEVYLKRFYSLLLDYAVLHFPSVRDFRTRIQEQNIKNFCALDIEQLKIAQERVRERILNRIPDFNSFTNSRDEVGILKRELMKQRNIMPLRKLFKEIPNLISILKPCFLMSPLSVSVLLEAQCFEFDMIIFDEASQIHTEDAIGAIMRGKQIIVVGDTKQLPPTNFFTTSLNDDEFDIDDEDSDDGSYYDSYESILEEIVTILPERSLRWHYRSRDESLIAFSNIKIYNNSLITFPSSINKAENLGVEYIYVADGIYDRGGKKNNLIEAKRVADLVFEHFEKYPNRSLGVVAFSEAQQNAIELAIRKRRLLDGKYENFFADNQQEPFFIKNLENVQGDERDTIIFSIGYAKDRNGIMYMNFGPLSREGGFRRLNVAITRAKFNLKLVGSIYATDIDLEKTSAIGVKLLRSYIEYAQQGIKAIDNELHYSNELCFDSPFEESVYDFLVSKGYNVVTQVGCSGYRIDLAIKHPINNNKFILGIECDGASYHSSRTVRERDRLRETILEDMGWRIYRIWSTDWIKNRGNEEEKLISAIQCAIDDKESNTINASIQQIELTEINEIEVKNENHQISLSPDNKYGFDYYSFDYYSPLVEAYNNHLKAAIADYIQYKRTFQKEDLERGFIKKLIEAEQPVHFDVLCKLFAPIVGGFRVTPNIKEYVKNILAQLGGIRIDGEFVMFEDFKDLRVRIPQKDSLYKREIQHIYEKELELAILTILRKSIGITPKALMAETSNEYGFSRMGNRITFILNKVYNQLINDGKIKEINNKVALT